MQKSRKKNFKLHTYVSMFYIDDIKKIRKQENYKHFKFKLCTVLYDTTLKNKILEGGGTI